ncbi:MAG: DUF3445 domain-containing protein [Pseudomonadota bacterium]
MLPKHTPYDGSTSSFAIGLMPLALENWIEVDDHLPRYLAEKQKLMGQIPDRVWAGDFSSETAQQEVLDLLVPYLRERFPEIYSQTGNLVSIKDAGDVDLGDVSRPPLLTAAYLVQEDLVIMRKTEAGWRLVAASVCFPSSWVLREKIGKVMHDIHAPVPGFQQGTRNATMIERIFDNLLIEQPVERFNWSVYNDDKLYHDDRAGEHFPDHETVEQTGYFLRIEHQTLRKLPASGDILFTIRIHIDPIEMLAKRSDRAKLIPEFVKTIRAMSEAEMDYKGFDKGSERLIDLLEAMT